MRFLSLALSAFAAALLFAGCSGGGTPTPSTGSPVASGPFGSRLVDSGIARPKFLRLMRTPPFPPPRKHKVTSAMRARARAAGWEQMSSVPSFQNGPGSELLLTDGTVIVQDYCTSNWYRLTPDSSGNYLTGTWAQIGSMPSDYAPLYYASAVLPNGYVIVNGGEYNGASCSGVETNLGAMYDPFNNTWTAVSPPSGWARIGDGQSVVLSNGTYMLGNCCYMYQALYNQASNTWTQTGPGNGKQDVNSEEGWTLLPNGDVLVVNVSTTPYAQVYVPSENEWVAAGQLPVNIVTGYEIGPQTLRPNGTVFVAGATGANVVYNVSSGAWTQTASFPEEGGQQLDVADGPSALLTDGKVMIPASPGLYNSPTYYFIFGSDKLKSITAPPNAVNDSTYNTRLLLLPNGQIMEVDGSTDIEFYTASKAESALRPVITSVPTTIQGGSTYTATGTGFNGSSQANFYGDDNQQATNFPLVRVTVGGSVYYCRTHGISFMGVASSQSVSTSFDVPSTIKAGTGKLEVVADGIHSKPTTVTVQSTPHRRG
jgi:hypothetical protein